jgi:hypothetical protein
MNGGGDGFARHSTHRSDLEDEDQNENEDEDEDD